VNKMQQEFIRLDSLATKGKKAGLLPISPATVWRYCRDGLLTPPIKLGPRITAWPTAEITAVTKARHAGASEKDIRVLVKKLVAQRGAA
jgi:prophage regulatory protein